MARLPDGYSLNGGLAFRGAPAHGNPVARQLVSGPTASQLEQSVQQMTSRQEVNAETQASQMAVQYKLATQRLLNSMLPGAFEATESLALNPGALADVAAQMQV